MTYDIAVIGGGPAGYSGALYGAKLGGKVVLFEKEHIGGVCLNAGCIPTKCYAHHAHVIDCVRRDTGKGIYRQAGMFSFEKIFDEKQRVVKRLTAGVAALLKAAGVAVVKAEARVKSAHTILAAGVEYRVKKILICTGSQNALPPIPGIRGDRVVDSTGLLRLKRLPRSLTIIGAGVIGLEFASILSAMGSGVTLVDVLPGLLPGEDREAVALLEGCLKKKMGFRLGAKVSAIGDSAGQKAVSIRGGQGDETLLSDYVLVAAGRVPVNGIPQELGLALDDKGFVQVDDFFRSSLPDIYAAGDIIGGPMLAHSAYMEAETAVQNALGQRATADLGLMPRCIFSAPQFAAVGRTEPLKGEKEGEEVAFGRFPMKASGKAACADGVEGFVKFMAKKQSGELLGCTIVGGEAAEMIMPAVTALRLGAKAEDFLPMIFPHPTLGESVREAVLDIAGLALHIPQKH